MAKSYKSICCCKIFQLSYCNLSFFNERIKVRLITVYQSRAASRILMQQRYTAPLCTPLFPIKVNNLGLMSART